MLCQYFDRCMERWSTFVQATQDSMDSLIMLFLETKPAPALPQSRDYVPQIGGQK